MVRSRLREALTEAQLQALRSGDRKARSLSWLALQLGCSRSTVQRFTTDAGIAAASVQTLESIAQVLQLPISAVVELDAPTEPAAAEPPAAGANSSVTLA